MNTLRSTHWAKMVLTVVMLCALLLQVQTVFACQMMDHSGPIEHCCCDDDSSPMAMGNDQASSMQCCEYSLNVSMGVEVDENEPVILTSYSSLDPPPTTIVFLLVALWPELTQASQPPLHWDLESQPAHPGTSTWLSTSRLRI